MTGIGPDDANAHWFCHLPNEPKLSDPAREKGTVASRVHRPG